MSTRKVQKFDAFKMKAYYFLAICIILKRNVGELQDAN